MLGAKGWMQSFGGGAGILLVWWDLKCVSGEAHVAHWKDREISYVEVEEVEDK
jgi:hypothetical protein